MKKYLFIFYFLCISSFLLAQDYQITWQNCFGGSEIDYAMDIVKINDNYLMAGICTSDDGDIIYTHGNGDGWVIMIDSTGNILWQRNYGGSLGDWFVKIVPSNNDEFYLIGLSGSSDYDISFDPYPGSYDYWIVKIDIDGNIIWDRIVGGNWGETIWSGFGTSDSGVVAYGWTDSDDGDVSQFYGGNDAWMIKLSSEGEIEWDYTVGTDWVDVGQAAMQTSDGGYIMACNANMLGNGTGNITCTPHSLGWNEAVLFKLDANLNLEWQQCYGGSDHDGITAIMEVSDGYVFVAYTGSNDGDVSGWHGDDDIWVVKIDYYGTIIWQNPLGGSYTDGLGTLTQLSNGDIVTFAVTGSDDGDVSGYHGLTEFDLDIWFVKLNSEGELIDQQCIGGIGREYLHFGVVHKSDNNYVVAGQTNYGPSYDVACELNYLTKKEDWWVFEFKDCSQYMPAIPQTPTGPDTVCTIGGQQDLYSIAHADKAWYYEWDIEPEGAATITGDSLVANVKWTDTYEGTITIAVRSINDCGESDWSLPLNVEAKACVGIDKIYGEGIGVGVYPNPAGEYVVFELPANTNKAGAAGTQGDSSLRFGMTGVIGANVVIVDVFGREVARKEISLEKTYPPSPSFRRTKIDLSQFQEGVYFYRLEIDGYHYSGKFVVRR